MTCARSAHTLHTILRGCCGTSCTCPLPSAFSAWKYCECNDTPSNNAESFAAAVCARFAETVSGITFHNVTDLNTYMTSLGCTGGATGASGCNDYLNFGIINCVVPVYLLSTTATTIASAVQIGTINFGVYVPLTPVPTVATGSYFIYPAGVVPAAGTGTCASTTLSILNA